MTKPASRSATRLIGGHFPRAVSIQLNVLAAQLETTNQALLTDALDMLFRAHKLPTVRELMTDTILQFLPK